jgi:hypothetical protein
MLTQHHSYHNDMTIVPILNHPLLEIQYKIHVMVEPTTTIHILLGHLNEIKV